MELRLRHWATAALAAATLHGGAFGLFWIPTDTDGAAAAAGYGGFAVSLGPAGAAPGLDAPTAEDVAELSEIAPAASAETEPEPIEPAPPPVESAEQVEPVEDLPSETVEAAPAEPDPVQEMAEAAPDPLPEPPVEAEPVLPEDVSEPMPEALPEPPAPEPAQPPAAAEAAPEPLPEPPPAKPSPPVQVAMAVPEVAEPVEEAAPLAAPIQPAPTEATAGDQGTSGQTAEQESGDGNVSPGGGPTGLEVSYGTTLSTWIQKHHRFSRRLERRQLYGTAIVSFTIDRDGNLLTYEIVKSSGHEAIDEAAIETLKRASPMPPVPEELTGAQYTPLPLPIEFNPPS